MVFIKKIEARGFKSFGSELVTIKIDQDFTAITGPNGSGKSNIIDSIIFCLGQNSPKKLRVNKLTSLIYDGGPEIKKPQTIRVTITFDNTTRRLPINSNNVSVTRELRYTGENQYYLNGKRISKKALIDLLDIALIAPEGLNMVPQGLITHLAELNPDEKRELIEEIVGVAQFDDKKKTAQEQLREADTKLQIAMARIGEIQSRVDSLESEMNDQLRLKILEDEVRWLKAVIASKNIDTIKKRIKDNNKLLKDYQKAKNNLEKDLNEINIQIENAESERKKFVSTVIDSSGGEKIELQFAIGKSESDISRLKDEISSAKNLIRKIENSLPEQKKLFEKHTNEMKIIQNNIIEDKNKIKEIEKKKNQTNITLNNISNQIEKLKISREKKKTLNDDYIIQKTNYKEKMNTVTRQIDIYNNKKELLEEDLVFQKEKTQTFKETLQLTEEQLKKLEDLEILEKESIDKVGISIDGLSKREMDIQEEVSKAIGVLSKAGDAVLRYEIQRSMAEKIIGHEIGQKRLEDLAKTGAIKGYIGRIDKLLSYQPKYEQAIQAAGRRWINAAVVNDLRSMMKIIEISKRLKVGNITVIPLSEVKGSKKIILPKNEGIIGTLADVIKSDSKLEGLVNFLFGDIVLVSNSQDGYLVATKGFKSVTKTGDLFEPKGVAFETGYITKLDEILKLVQDEASLKVIKEALSSLKNTISKRKLNIDNLQDEAKRLSNEKIRITSSLARIKIERNSLTNYIKKYKKINRDMTLRYKKNDREHNIITRKISKLSSDQDSIKKKIEYYETKLMETSIKKIDEEIKNLNDEKTIKLRFLEDISKNLRENVTQLTRNTGNIDHNLRPSYIRLKEQIKISESTLKDKKKIFEEGTEKLKSLLNNLAIQKKIVKKTISKSKKSTPIIEKYEDQLKRMTNNREKIWKATNNIEKETISTTNNIERLQNSEQDLLGEITLYGYTKPIEIFENADILLEQLDIEYQQLKNQVNLLAASSYKEIFSGYKNLSIRQNQLEKERTTIVKFIENIDSEKKKVFLSGFEKIDKELRIIFSKITGGSAWLELEDPDNIFSKGIFLMAQFPDKIPRESMAVSGGEKTVSALSVILAIQSVYPSPFYLFDEIDAHLDVKNSERLAELLRERANNSQIISVTLKDSMLTKASIIYGLYIEKGTSRLIKYKTGVGAMVKSG